MKSLMPEVLVRKGPPNKFDHAPHNTQCKVFVNLTDYELYIQTSYDIDNPKWERIAVFRDDVTME